MDQDTIKKEIFDFLGRMGFEGDIETIDAYQGAANRFSVRLRGEAPLSAGRHEDQSLDERESSRVPATSMLIGERGSTLAATEHILKKIIRKKYGEEYKFTLDMNDYRMRRLEDLKQDVKTAAKEVRLYQKEVPLRPMSSFERRIVHMLLAEYPDIITESIGEEPARRVIIKPYP